MSHSHRNVVYQGDLIDVGPVPMWMGRGEFETFDGQVEVLELVEGKMLVKTIDPRYPYPFWHPFPHAHA